MINFDTVPTSDDPMAFIDTIDHVRRHHDSKMLVEMMTAASDEPAVLWQGGVIGFGQYHYRYKTGREGEWPLIAFSPTVESLTLHVLTEITAYKTLINAIGRVKQTENSLIFYKLSDINSRALRQFIEQLYQDMKAANPVV